MLLSKSKLGSCSFCSSAAFEGGPGMTRKEEAAGSFFRLVAVIAVLIGVAALAQAPAGNKLYASAHLKQSTVYASVLDTSFSATGYDFVRRRASCVGGRCGPKRRR